MESPILEKMLKDPEAVQNLTAVLWPAEFIADDELVPSTDGTRIDIKRADGNALTAENKATVSAAVEAFERNLMAHLEAR